MPESFLVARPFICFHHSVLWTSAFSHNCPRIRSQWPSPKWPPSIIWPFRECRNKFLTFLGLPFPKLLSSRILIRLSRNFNSKIISPIIDLRLFCGRATVFCIKVTRRITSDRLLWLLSAVFSVLSPVENHKILSHFWECHIPRVPFSTFPTVASIAPINFPLSPSFIQLWFIIT